MQERMNDPNYGKKKDIKILYQTNSKGERIRTKNYWRFIAKDNSLDL